MKKIISLFFISLSLSAFNYKGYDQNLKIQTKNNQVYIFTINIVKTPQEQAQGLMWVTDLPDNYGMLFEFKDEQMIYMWMKDTKIPLDMLFIDKNNKIISIKEMAQPESLDVISSRREVVKVLEINGGKVSALGIKIGDKILVNDF